VFVTLEDEYGFLNIVLWAKVFEKFHHLATTARLLVVHGRIERSDEPRGSERAREKATLLPNPNAPQSVVHVIAERLEPLDERLPKLGTMSRDFH
jgi:error-prone DNA polymerase